MHAVHWKRDPAPDAVAVGLVRQLAETVLALPVPVDAVEDEGWMQAPVAVQEKVVYDGEDEVKSPARKRRCSE
jgi:hypothetical protein